jgi:threonine dehydrogenase-like Zn-dependent dehydrogenase
MKALIVQKPGKLTLGEIAAPKPGRYEALVRIRGCGICSTTDRELIRGKQPYHRDYPAVLGHESIGEVVETGDRVRAFRVGDRVTRPTALWPGTTRDGLASAWGGFAEWGIAKDRLAMARDGDASLLENYTALRQQVVPDGVSTGEAVLAISLAETASWFRHLPSVAGRTVCISGTGIAGFSMILWSLFAGARRIFVLGRREERLRAALVLGADHALDVRQGPLRPRIEELNEGRGVDFFLEAVGHSDQVAIGLSLLSSGGTVGIYGVPESQAYDFPLGRGAGWFNIAKLPAEEHLAYSWACSLIRQRKVPADKLMTHHWPFSQYRQAFAAVTSPANHVIKGWLEL